MFKKADVLQLQIVISIPKCFARALPAPLRRAGSRHCWDELCSLPEEPGLPGLLAQTVQITAQHNCNRPSGVEIAKDNRQCSFLTLLPPKMQLSEENE